MENQPKVTVEKQFRLKVWDFLEGMYDAVILPVLVTILEMLQAGSFDLDWNSIKRIAVAAFVSFLLKALAKPTKVVVEQPTPETPDLVANAIARHRKL